MIDKYTLSYDLDGNELGISVNSNFIELSLGKVLEYIIKDENYFETILSEYIFQKFDPTYEVVSSYGDLKVQLKKIEGFLLENAEDESLLGAKKELEIQILNQVEQTIGSIKTKISDLNEEISEIDLSNSDLDSKISMYVPRETELNVSIAEVQAKLITETDSNIQSFYNAEIDRMEGLKVDFADIISSLNNDKTELTEQKSILVQESSDLQNVIDNNIDIDPSETNLWLKSIFEGDTTAPDRPVFDTETKKSEWKLENYAVLRKSAYGSPEQQLEILGEGGIIAFADHVEAVKLRFPKPVEVPPPLI